MKPLKFEVTFEEANAIVAALMKGPMDTVEKLVTKLRVQAAEQLQEKEVNQEAK